MKPEFIFRNDSGGFDQPDAILHSFDGDRSTGLIFPEEDLAARSDRFYVYGHVVPFICFMIAPKLTSLCDLPWTRPNRNGVKL